jgi:ATP-binding cassette subfamily B protein
LIPEVVQTSAMDCGPASLKAFLEGFGVPVSYGRLREACQTDVDGTSIDALEEIAVQLGLDAEQVMVPLDHVLIEASGSLPAIAVVRLPQGDTHFQVAWSKLGPFVQVMDPGTGRSLVRRARFLDDLYVHTMPVPAAAFRDYAGSEAFVEPLLVRLAELGLSRAAAQALVARGASDPSVRTIAAVDAAARMVESLARSGGLVRGAATVGLTHALVDEALTHGDGDDGPIPPTYWTARTTDPDDDGNAQVMLRGAVLLRANGPRTRATDEPPLSPELQAALDEKPVSAAKHLLALLREEGVLTPTIIVSAMMVAGAAGMLEALLFRGLFEVQRSLGLLSQRLGAALAIVVFLAALLFLEVPIAASVQRVGRHLEARLRVAFLRKIPRLGDRYFHSRPTSDMAQRGHSVQAIRALPELGAQLVRSLLELLVTTIGIVWIDPASLPMAVTVAVLAVLLPLALAPVLNERDMRARTHAGSIGRFYLDAFLGLSAIRSHGAERSVRREHESLLSEWARASLSLQRLSVLMEGAHAFIGLALAGAILIGYLARSHEASRVLLLAYWALALPTIGESIAGIARRYPGLRNLTLRLMEPLGALEEETVARQGQVVHTGPARIAFRDMRVVAAGHTLLDELNVDIAPGEHVAIVGPSGAGKSTLVSVLLGWHRAASGEARVDGELLDGPTLAALRLGTAWVDPAVQLWNRSLFENLTYGGEEGAPPSPGTIEASDLLGVLERLPEGFQTPLGEGGALLSGGEGQRVRLARAMQRRGARLVILDEPFRGLDREKRRELLSRARALWQGSTLLCVTHDVGETQSFERVLVIEGGRVIEDGAPSELLATSSRYRDLVEAEEAVRVGVWSASEFRRVRIERGRMHADEERA